jgi:hypothetical protein
MGFDSFLASSASSPAAAGWRADDWARAPVDRHTKEMAASAEPFRYGEYQFAFTDRTRM